MECDQSLTESVSLAYNSHNREQIKDFIEALRIAYKNGIPDLRIRMSMESEKAAGLLSSVYLALTNDFGPVLELPFGGLGAIIKSSPKGLVFKDQQLHFATISGNALQASELRGTAFYFGLATRSSLWYARCFDDAGAFAEYRNSALRGSVNKDRAHSYCKLFDFVAMKSYNKDEAFSNPECVSKHVEKFIRRRC